MVAHWRALPSVREGGVAASAGQPEEQARNMALLTGAVAALLLLVPVAGPVRSLLPLVFAGFVAFGFTRYVSNKLGGHTGDTIGATQQLSEIALLTGLALAL
jgi:adenosylcobinamide-GDP ribazoletransferase